MILVVIIICVLLVLVLVVVVVVVVCWLCHKRKNAKREYLDVLLQLHRRQ